MFYRRVEIVVIGVIKSADRHHFVVTVKRAGHHFGDSDSPGNITELDGQHRVVALRVAVVVDPDGRPSHA